MHPSRKTRKLCSVFICWASPQYIFSLDLCLKKQNRGMIKMCSSCYIQVPPQPVYHSASDDNDSERILIHEPSGVSSLPPLHCLHTP